MNIEAIPSAYESLTLEPEANTMLTATIQPNASANLAHYEANAQLITQIKAIALNNLTAPHDWVDQDGHPYLQATGAEKLIMAFGITYTIKEPTKKELENNHYYYETTGDFEFRGITLKGIIGTKSTRNKLYKNIPDNDIPYKIDETVIKKGAFTNCEVNGITRILGLRNLTWEYLEEFTNGRITPNNTTRIKYNKYSKPSSPSPRNAPTNSFSPKLATDKQLHFAGKLYYYKYDTVNLNTYRAFLKQVLNKDIAPKKDATKFFDVELTSQDASIIIDTLKETRP